MLFLVKGLWDMVRFNWKHSVRWSVFISIVTFFLACIFSVVSTFVLDEATVAIGMIVVLMIVAIGIVFDMMGLASASAQEQPFHAMAAEKVTGSKQAIYIVRNADRFSNFCNDVIGDICGIISGTALTLVMVKLLGQAMEQDDTTYAVVTVVFSGVLSALMVGGKAIGKSISITYAIPIVLWMGKVFYILERRVGIRIWQRKRHNKKRGTKRAAR